MFARYITTKHGNRYETSEFSEMMANWDAEVEQAQDYIEACDNIKSVATGKLAEMLGIERKKAYQVIVRVWNDGVDAVQFTNETNRQAVQAIEKWMNEQERKAR